MSDEEKRLHVVKMVMDKMPQGSDMEYAVKQASILYEYIYNNQIPTKNK